MPTYVLLTTLTPDGRESLHKNPSRLEAVNSEIEALGCKVVAQYALLGAYDFLNIIEAPDNETMAHVSIDLGARKTATFTTLPAMSIKDLSGKLSGARHLAR